MSQSQSPPPGKKLVPRWYFGGISATGAACCTHPLDLLKVHIQTQQAGKIGVVSQAVQIVSKQGFLALYSGLTASMLRQATYSTTRFGLYEIGKQWMTSKGKGDLTFAEKVGLAALSGSAGGFVGTPGDVINVRMQNDIKLPPDKRRNYKHAIDGLIRVVREEGFRKLFAGASMATARGLCLTVGQLSFYDQVKGFLIATGNFKDGFVTHFLSSLTAGAVATFMTQPVDVLKTRLMNSKPGEFRSLFHLISYTAQLGPQGFFKGFVPAFIRLGPQTVITFLFLEQLRQNFGVYIDA